MAKDIDSRFLMINVLFIFIATVCLASHSVQAEKIAGSSWEQALENGPFNVSKLEIKAGKPSTAPSPPPNDLWVAVPVQEGDYPVLIFLHGFLMHAEFYSNILEHVASHGYIVIAPQFYRYLSQSNATEDVEDAAEITRWLPGGLRYYLDAQSLEEVRPNFSNVALSGHSRGGKVSFALAMGLQGIKSSLNFSALIGLDPVDGPRRGSQSEPPVLTYHADSFNLSFPVLVVGSGLGGSCVPEGVNHKEFYNECRAPAYYFVASEYGHMDFLDATGLEWVLTLVCSSGSGKALLQKFAGGIFVAFLKNSVGADPTALDEILKDPSLALPVKLDPPKSKLARPSVFDDLPWEI